MNAITDPPPPPPSLQPGSEPGPAEAGVRRSRGLSIVWLVPLVAGVIAAWLAYSAVTSQGPRITITFETAEGLEAGKTKIKYRDVDVGEIETVGLSPDLARIVVTARMVKGASPYMTTGTRFWIVKPRVGTGGVSGLGTLLSGAYVEVDPGQGDSTREFTGLEEPPQLRFDTPGTTYVLRADTLGSVSRGAPIYYRGIEVGQVLGYQLAQDAGSLAVQVFVRHPYDDLVHTNSRFWNASGIGLNTSASGIRVDVASLQALLVGGIEFDTPSSVENTDKAPNGTGFQLFASLQDAQEAQFTRKVPYLVDFDGSARGLSTGAPVETRGIRIGSVADVRLAYSRARSNLVVQALIEIEPERVQALDAETGQPMPRQAMDELVARGLRAQLKTGNLLTGELYVELDFYPTAPAAKMARVGDYPVIPSVPTDLEAIQASLTSVMDKIAALPLPELVDRLNRTVGAIEAIATAPELRTAVSSAATSMTGLQATLQRLDTSAVPLLDSLKVTADRANAALAQTRDTMAAAERSVGPTSPLNADLTSLLRELQSAARSIRVFADYLDRHPEALVRGKGGP